ncbi:MAG: SDR family oxidoreductase [Oscillospiraceae bacterium]|jgi:short-subunit dehydrogenase|nr:SDR family oxidoreductase [Oscillospiraceae bacterium]
MVNVKGRWALVTGASRGVGAQIAKFMAERGCNLILHSREASHTKEVLSEVLAAGVKAYAVSADLADAAQVQTMLDSIEDKGTTVDIVFNNAGVQIAYRSGVYDTPAEDFSSSFLINTIAPAMICYHFLPKMIKRGFGRILNTTSGIRLDPQQAGYSASKAALDKFTIDLGTKVNGTDVALNLNDPGWCRTDLGGPYAPNAVESVLPGIVVGAFIDDKKSGRNFGAQDFAGLTLEDAVRKAESYDSPY